MAHERFRYVYFTDGVMNEPPAIEMTSRRVMVAFVLGASLASISCSKSTPVTGQVFITTNEGSSVKLGGVDVLALSQVDLGSAVQELEPQQAAERTALIASAKAAQAVLTLANSRLAPPEERFHSFITGNTTKISPSDALQLWQSDEKLALEEIKRELPGERFEAKRRELGRRLERTTETFGRLAEIGPLAKAAASAKVNADLSRSRFESWPTAEFYFSHLPKPIASTVTNADGNFSLIVPARKRFAIAVHADRNLPLNSEQLYWLIWVEPDQVLKPLLLTNRNLATARSSDSVIHARAATMPSDQQKALTETSR